MAGTENPFEALDPSTSTSAEPDFDPPPGFDEAAYLEAYPDVAASVRSGEWISALHHYRTYGALENRLSDSRYARAVAGGSTVNFPPACLDRCLVSGDGYCFVSGWVADTQQAPLRQIAINQNKSVIGVTKSIARHRRIDVEAAESKKGLGLVGFWALVDLQCTFSPVSDIDVTIKAAEERRVFSLRPTLMSSDALREDALLAIANARYFGDYEVETFIQLDTGAVESLISLNLGLVKRDAHGAYQESFGVRRSSYLGSIVVVLYGKAEFLTLQAALFSECCHYDEYEFIYVSNSPELAETLIRDAKNASRLYGIAITLILLPGNVGFGVANNLGAQAAESDRILFLNPDVLPRDRDWPRMHAALVKALPATQTALFGVPLFYADGSLMHGGIYIDMDGGCSVQNGRLIRREILRVEHYGKGAPAEALPYLTARPVTAVTGAFMSVDRGWFERLGGFSKEYIYGHYEDVDLCLKSLQAGAPVWLHDIPFWHLESVGATRAPVHDSARLINRWRLTAKWGELVRSELSGKAPIRFDK